jgi:hypothetical protein
MLPPHLQRYDGLLDLLVEAIVREMEQEAESAIPEPEAVGNRAPV